MEKPPQSSMPSILSYFNFLCFIPTILIGPIDKYSHFKKSEDSGFSSLTVSNFISGLELFFKGFVFKYICAEIVDRYILNGGIKYLIVDMYSYYIYLFFDFAGSYILKLNAGEDNVNKRLVVVK